MHNINVNISVNQLRDLVNRIENLEKTKNDINEDLKQIYLEAKNNGYDIKILKKVISLRKKGNEAFQEEELLKIYLNALGDN